MRDAIAICLDAIDAGWATTDRLRQASAWRCERRPQIGKLAMLKKKLTVAQVFAILGQQAIDGGMFGKIATDMGLLSSGDLYELLEMQAQMTPTLADALVAPAAR